MSEEIVRYDVVIVGAGPAGLTAAIYAKRAGMSTIILEGKYTGGLIALSPQIENYPGFQSISGLELVNKIAEHAKQYAEIKEGEQVKDIKVNSENIELITDTSKYIAKAVILATGTEYRKLDAKGAKEFEGRGISYCATCDGFFFKGKKVIVVGGGNSAAREALHLKHVGCKVTIVHRRDKMRAEDTLLKRLLDEGIEFEWDSVVEEILGDSKVTAVKIRNVKSNQTKTLDVSGIFVAIGMKPNSELASLIGAHLDSQGYIIVDDMMRTSIKRIYAAGDVTGGLRQVITACAKGAIAATACKEVVHGV